MVEKEIKVTNPTGLHTRPANQLVKLLKSYQSDVTIENKGKSIKAKSLLNIMKLNVVQDDVIKIYVEGSDEKEEAEAIVKLISELKD